MHALILAGGLGTRLRTKVSSVPKPMAPVNGHPFLEYLLHYWSKQGIQRFTISIGYMGSIISDYFGTQYGKVAIDYVTEESPLGTGGALRKALGEDIFDAELAVLLNGDTWFEASLPDLLINASEDVTMFIALRRISANTRYGGVRLSANNRIDAFGDTTSTLINTGCYLFAPHKLKAVLKAFPEKFSLENDVLPQLAQQKQLVGLEQTGRFIDIGIPEDYDAFCQTYPNITFF